MLLFNLTTFLELFKVRGFLPMFPVIFCERGTGKNCRSHWRRQLWGTGACPHLNFRLCNFSRHFKAAQTLTFDSVWLPLR